MSKVNISSLQGVMADMVGAMAAVIAILEQTEANRDILQQRVNDIIQSIYEPIFGSGNPEITVTTGDCLMSMEAGCKILLDAIDKYRNEMD